MSAGGPPQQGPGDLGRRIMHRREELGLSREELADRAGMALPYLRRLEEGVVSLPTGGLLRLAAALATDQNELLGAHAGLPPGGGGPAAHPRLEVLDEAECRRLLSDRGVGRVVYSGERAPVTYPVNYRVVDGAIVFRTNADSELAAHIAEEAISFEVDRIDEPTGTGWSVLASGRSERVGRGEAAALRRALDLEPWAGGDRDVFVRIPRPELTGRRIVA